MSNHVPPPYESVDDILRELEAIDEERMYYYRDRERLKQVVARQQREIDRLRDELEETISCLAERM